jgi:hypothetical protein
LEEVGLPPIPQVEVTAGAAPVIDASPPPDCVRDSTEVPARNFGLEAWPAVPTKWAGDAHKFFLEEHIGTLHNCVRDESRRGGIDNGRNGKVAYPGLAMDD